MRYTNVNKLIMVQLLSWWLVPCKPRNPACLPYWLSLSPLYLWLLVFWPQPHKVSVSSSHCVMCSCRPDFSSTQEERFLFPVYPLICLCGAVTLDSVQKLWFRLKQVVKLSAPAQPVQHYLRRSQGLALTVLIICCALGVSRSFSLYRGNINNQVKPLFHYTVAIILIFTGYHAPLDVYMEFSKIAAQETQKEVRPINVCVGKEWHRFPSSFFLPDNKYVLRMTCYTLHIFVYLIIFLE